MPKCTEVTGRACHTHWRPEEGLPVLGFGNFWSLWESSLSCQRGPSGKHMSGGGHPGHRAGVRER